MKLSIITAPYDSGHYHVGFGQGPEALIAGGIVEALALNGHDVDVVDIGEIGAPPRREIAQGFAVCRAVAGKVDASVAEGRFPIVLAGNCLTALGAMAGEAADSVVWVDQHGDVNTPETSIHGFLDGMALAVALGLCWKPMAASIPGFRPLDPARCMLVDARDLDPEEKVALDRLPIIRAGCGEAVEKVAKLKAAGVGRTHLHLDLDVHDPKTLQVNRYTAPGGPGPQEVRRMACGIARSIPIAGLTLTAYDPAFDAKAEVPPLVGELLIDFLAALERI
ncbi:arginase family protein [Mesorhizobium sp. LHD-90]|uniref:arginase family protein n=1 Tax=Mesorhizobium sp. LHD-90 TaxID=3071414 RepID=UPI0027E1A12A|nr:arginase family protein [Mesorhizobium sp. LHD-90]MDQ6434187.1 arginase family protein [Mesorhizobium sp. LHD-90]